MPKLNVNIDHVAQQSTLSTPVGLIHEERLPFFLEHFLLDTSRVYCMNDTAPNNYLVKIYKNSDYETVSFVLCRYMFATVSNFAILEFRSWESTVKPET